MNNCNCNCDFNNAIHRIDCAEPVRALCCFGPTGPTGPEGPIGPIGLTGTSGPGLTIYLATDQSICDHEWLGLGTSSLTSFNRSTVVIPQDAIITGLVLNIRNNTLPDTTITATIFTSSSGFENPINTGISVTIKGPSDEETPNCVGIATGSFAVTQGSLLSVQITTGSKIRELSRGVAVTIFLTLP